MPTAITGCGNCPDFITFTKALSNVRETVSHLNSSETVTSTTSVPKFPQRSHQTCGNIPTEIQTKVHNFCCALLSEFNRRAKMTKLHLVLQIIGVIALVSSFPHGIRRQHRARDVPDYSNLEDFNQANEDVQQFQSHDDLVEDSQQQTQNEDLTQFQEQLGQIQQHPDAEEFSQQQTQNEDLTQFQEQLGQIQQHPDAEEFSQQQTQNEDLTQFQEQLGQIQQHPDAEEFSQQQTQNEDLTQFQEQLGQIQQHPDAEEFSQQQTHNQDLRQFQEQSGNIQQFPDAEDFSQQQTQNEDLTQFQEQLGQIQQHPDAEELSQQQTQNEDLTQFQEQLGQIQQHPDAEEFSQQQTQNEDLTQFQEQLGQIQQHPDAEEFSQQQTQNEDLTQFQEQLGKIQQHPDAEELSQLQTHNQDLREFQEQQAGQIQQHPDIEDFSQQLTQNEDLTQFQQGQIQQIPADEEYTQQTQNEDLQQFQQQLGKIELDPDSEQQLQFQDLDQYQQGQLNNGKQIERLEDFPLDTEGLQISQKQEELRGYQQQSQDLNQVQPKEIRVPEISNEPETPEFPEDKEISKYDEVPQGKESEIQQTRVEDLSQSPQLVEQDDREDNTQQLIQTGPKSERLEDFGEEIGLEQQNTNDQQVLDNVNLLDLSQDQSENLNQGQTRIEIFEDNNQRNVPVDLNNDNEALEQILEGDLPQMPEIELNTENQFPDFNGYGRSNPSESNKESKALNEIEEELEEKVVEDLHQHSPGLWERFKNKVSSTYKAAKDKAKGLVDTVREKVG
ncbi:hypothetical protein J437_LFUL000902 [Ladona fulva]|uniref:Uncharacterized protein n=1 Tax=Ladona fulva TaxID=123851 RepID=A0A8K0K6Q3_LADFU|nr:hypothetical protein J437_LFUL000902 [Ladona fulva]